MDRHPLLSDSVPSCSDPRKGQGWAAQAWCFSLEGGDASLLCKLLCKLVQTDRQLVRQGTMARVSKERASP